MSLMPHPNRYNFIDEYVAWCDMRGYSARQALRCLQIMQKLEYNFAYNGLFQLNFAIVRNNGATKEFHDTVYKLLETMGPSDDIERVDQIPFSMLMNKYCSHMKVLPVSGQIVESDYMQWMWHGSDTEIHVYKEGYDTSKLDIKYMFDKPVECFYLL